MSDLDGLEPILGSPAAPGDAPVVFAVIAASPPHVAVKEVVDVEEALMAVAQAVAHVPHWRSITVVHIEDLPAALGDRPAPE